jgi:hypothetical protein
MQDELDGQLLRHFAASQRPLADAQFLAQVTQQLHARAGADAVARVFHGVVRAILGGLAVGIAAPLRLRYAGLVALAAAAVTLATALVSSL